MNGNDFMAWMLRSPLHGMLSNTMMLITVTGRKTGKTYTTPVEYYMEDGSLWVMSNRDRTWWRNLQGGANVGLSLKRKSVQGFADVELDQRAVEAHVSEYLRRTPQAARLMNIRVENGKPNPEDIALASKTRLFVKIRVLE